MKPGQITKTQGQGGKEILRSAVAATFHLLIDDKPEDYSSEEQSGLRKATRELAQQGVEHALAKIGY